MAVELVPLGTARIHLKAPITLEGTPRGTRMIVELEDTVLEGERLQAKQKGTAAADWVIVGPDGCGMLDVRYCVETHDGALIYVQYSGRVDVANGVGSAPVYSAPTFETGDSRYAWLNKVQAVAKGTVGDDLVLVYEVYELR
jgi:hypothetical protein